MLPPPLPVRTTLRFVVFLLAALALAACGGSSSPPSNDGSAVPSAATPAPATDDGALVGKPQNRSGIGDVDRALSLYGESRKEMVDLIQAQGWYRDGLTTDEKLFVERMLSFVARYGTEREASITDATIKGRLFLHDKVRTRLGDTEIMLIYEPNQDAEREMAFIKAAVPALEAIVGVEWPERFVTVINGDFNTNDFNEGQFIRIARCCVNSAYVLAHELAHTYWSMGVPWFNEGMADLYASLTQTYLSDNPPPGWRFGPINLDAQYDQRKRSVARQPDMLLPRRLGSQGLYDFAFLLFMDVRRAIGVANFEKAAKDIYMASDFNRYTLRDKRLVDIFLANTPPEARQQVLLLFGKSLWGDNGEKYLRMVEQEGP